MSNVRIFANHAQWRLSSYPLNITMAGDDFDISTADGVWQCPVTNRIILEPSCLTSEYYTDSTGVNSKLSMSELTLGDSALFEERQAASGSGPWICIKNSGSTSSNRYGKSNATYSKNRGFFISFFCYEALERYLLYNVGIGPDATAAGSVFAAIFSSGLVKVYQGDTLIGEGDIGGNMSQGQFRSLMVLPFAHREILVYSPSTGKGFTVIVPGIEESDDDPTIMPAGKLWFRTPFGAAACQIAPLKFVAEGQIDSRETSLPEAPGTGETLGAFANDPWPSGSRGYLIYGHPAYVGGQDCIASLRQWDGSGFTPNGTRRNIKVRLILSSDNEGYTPTVYGATLEYPELYQQTHDSEVEITKYVQSFNFSGDRENTVLNLTCKSISEIEGVANGITVNNYTPVKMMLGDIVIFDGMAEQDGRYHGPTDGSSQTRLKCVSRAKFFQDYIHMDRYPLDGYGLKRALSTLFRKAFKDSEILVSDSPFAFPYVPQKNASEFALLIERGDTAEQWISELGQTYCPDWVISHRPTPSGMRMTATAPEDRPILPILTVYTSLADAMALSGVSTEIEALRLVIREFESDTMEPMATDVRVTGWNPRVGRPIQRHKVDSAAEAVTTAPNLRPTNWVGGKLPYIRSDASLTSDAVLEDCTDIAYERLTKSEIAANMSADFLISEPSGIPLMVGDHVTIHGRGSYEIEAFSFDGDTEPETGLAFRDTSYAIIKL